MGSYRVIAHIRKSSSRCVEGVYPGDLVDISRGFTSSDAFPGIVKLQITSVLS